MLIRATRVAVPKWIIAYAYRNGSRMWKNSSQNFERIPVRILKEFESHYKNSLFEKEKKGKCNQSLPNLKSKSNLFIHKK